MIEPTETESKETLDALRMPDPDRCGSADDPDLLKTATTPHGRLDEVSGQNGAVLRGHAALTRFPVAWSSRKFFIIEETIIAEQATGWRPTGGPGNHP
jgi:hypothetical protein